MKPEILGERIRKARERIGMPQYELADRVSKDQRAVSEYENGKRKLAAIDIPAFAEALNVPVSYFFEGDEILNDLERVLLNSFEKLSSPTVKKVAIDIVDSLSQIKTS